MSPLSSDFVIASCDSVFLRVVGGWCRLAEQLKAHGLRWIKCTAYNYRRACRTSGVQRTATQPVAGMLLQECGAEMCGRAQGSIIETQNFEVVM